MAGKVSISVRSDREHVGVLKSLSQFRVRVLPSKFRRFLTRFFVLLKFLFAPDYFPAATWRSYLYAHPHATRIGTHP